MEALTILERSFRRTQPGNGVRAVSTQEYCIALVANVVIIRGTKGRTVKEFNDIQSAQAYVTRQVNKKMQEGYRETGSVLKRSSELVDTFRGSPNERVPIDPPVIDCQRELPQKRRLKI